MDNNDRFKQMGKEASKDVVAQTKSWLQKCHYGWLWVGMFSGWVIDLVMNALFTIFNFIPVLGPVVVDSFLGPLDEMVVAFVPLMCLRELIRRWKSR